MPKVLQAIAFATLLASAATLAMAQGSVTPPQKGPTDQSAPPPPAQKKDDVGAPPAAAGPTAPTPGTPKKETNPPPEQGPTDINPPAPKK
jgi:hypothetical protein